MHVLILLYKWWVCLHNKAFWQPEKNISCSRIPPKIELSCRSTTTRREDNRNRSLSTEWEKRVSTCSPEIQKLLHPTAAHQTAAGRSVEVGSIISSDQPQTSYKHFSCSLTLTWFTWVDRVQKPEATQPKTSYNTAKVES